MNNLNAQLPIAIIAYALIAILSVGLAKRKKRAARNNPGRNSSAVSSAAPEAVSSYAKNRSREQTELSGKLHSPEHTHDRLDYDCYRKETPAEHYAKQARVFYKTGLIGKEEYAELLKRWSQY